MEYGGMECWGEVECGVLSVVGGVWRIECGGWSVVGWSVVGGVWWVVGWSVVGGVWWVKCSGVECGG